MLKWKRAQADRKKKIKPVEVVPLIFNWKLPANDNAGAQKSKKFNASGYNFMARLTKRGYTTLGSGYYSWVLYKKGDRVIKVIHSKDRWIDYIKWAAQEGHAGKFAPKVYSYKDFGTFAVAVMEKLEYTSRQAPGDHRMKIAWDLMQIAMRNPANYNARMFSELIVPGALDFSEKIEKKFKGADFHGGNFMIRKDGSFVFTDPVSGFSNTTYKRLRTKDLAA